LWGQEAKKMFTILERGEAGLKSGWPAFLRQTADFLWKIKEKKKLLRKPRNHLPSPTDCKKKKEGRPLGKRKEDMSKKGQKNLEKTCGHREDEKWNI